MPHKVSIFPHWPQRLRCPASSFCKEDFPARLPEEAVSGKDQNGACRWARCCQGVNPRCEDWICCVYRRVPHLHLCNFLLLYGLRSVLQPPGVAAICQLAQSMRPIHLCTTIHMYVSPIPHSRTITRRHPQPPTSHRNSLRSLLGLSACANSPACLSLGGERDRRLQSLGCLAVVRGSEVPRMSLGTAHAALCTSSPCWCPWQDTCGPADISTWDHAPAF